MTELTKEQLKEIIETDHVQCGEASAMARKLLANLNRREPEPAYWLSVHKFQSYLKFSKRDAEYDVSLNGGLYVVPLYTAPVEAPRVAEPVGYFVRYEDDDHEIIDQCSKWVPGAFPLYAAPPAPAYAEPIAWIYEDELPSGYPYDEMFPFSKVDMVRMFPVFAPSQPAPVAPVVPETLPCSVVIPSMLVTYTEGVKTETLLKALERRAAMLKGEKS